MKNRKNLGITLILFIIMNAFFGVFLVHFSNSPVFLDVKVEDKGKIPNNPVLADVPPIAYWAIRQNATSVYRLFESINFTLNTFGYSNIDSTLMEISFTNGSTVNYNMALIAPNEYYYEYRPEYNAPLGFQNVSFLLYNITDIINAHTTYTNFTIKTNYMVTTNSSEYLIGDDLYAELTVNDFGSHQFSWNITIVDNTIELLQQNISDLGNDLVQFTFRISNETFNNFVGQTSYIKLNMTDIILGQIVAAYFPFEILNSAPNIDGSSIRFSRSEVFRDEECEISLNVTDIEDPSQVLDISMTLEDPEGDFIASLTIDHNTGNNFSRQFSIPAGSPIGKYRITINAEDQNGGISSFLTFLTAKNNFPEIHNYLINGKSMNELISILYGNDLIFHDFNVSDVEEVAYIKVALINENKDWFNASISYLDYIKHGDITIRTIDLITGVWYVYIYVIDSDGATTSLVDDYNLAPQSIRIIPDVLSSFLPWTAFIIGTVLGILVGVGLAFRHYKKKFTETQPVTQKKKPSKKKKQKEEVTKKISEKESEEETPEKEVEKEVEKEIPPKRKIKRKL